MPFQLLKMFSCYEQTQNGANSSHMLNWTLMSNGKCQLFSINECYTSGCSVVSIAIKLSVIAGKISLGHESECHAFVFLLLNPHSCLPSDDFINANQLIGDDITVSSSKLSRKHRSQLVSASQLLTIGHCQTLAYLQPPMPLGWLMLFLIPERGERAIWQFISEIPGNWSL